MSNLPHMATIRINVPNGTVNDIVKFLTKKYSENNTFVWYLDKRLFRTTITLSGVTKDICEFFKEISWHVVAGSVKNMA